MATRGQVKTWIRNWLGTGADDALYGDQSPGVSAVLDPAVQQVVDQLLHDINVANRAYLSTFVTLQPNAPDSHLYALASQAAPVTDFHSWLELRYADENGTPLTEARLDELTDSGCNSFCVTGPDEAAVIQTNPDASLGPLWLRYTRWYPDLADDNTPIPGIPSRFHDVVALEALFVFAVGGESRWPEELRTRRFDRYHALMAHVARRGVQPSRTRVVNVE